MPQENGTREFVRDVKAVILAVATTIITAMIIWEATAIYNIEKRLGRLEAFFEMQKIPQIAGFPTNKQP